MTIPVIQTWRDGTYLACDMYIVAEDIHPVLHFIDGLKFSVVAEVRHNRGGLADGPGAVFLWERIGSAWQSTYIGDALSCTHDSYQLESN